MKARQIAIYLNNDAVAIEPGAMSYFKGNIEMVSGVTSFSLVFLDSNVFKYFLKKFILLSSKVFYSLQHLRWIHYFFCFLHNYWYNIPEIINQLNITDSFLLT